MSDDAQGTVFALMDREETTAGVRPLRIAMRALWVGGEKADQVENTLSCPSHREGE